MIEESNFIVAFLKKKNLLSNYYTFFFIFWLRILFLTFWFSFRYLRQECTKREIVSKFLPYFFTTAYSLSLKKKVKSFHLENEGEKQLYFSSTEIYELVITNIHYLHSLNKNLEYNILLVRFEEQESLNAMQIVSDSLELDFVWFWAKWLILFVKKLGVFELWLFYFNFLFLLWLFFLFFW